MGKRRGKLEREERKGMKEKVHKVVMYVPMYINETIKGKYVF